MTKKLLVLMLLLSSSFVIFAQEEDSEIEAKYRTGVDIEAYYSHRYSLGSLTELSSGNLGVGLSLEWTFPFLPSLGISGRVEWEYVLDNLDRIDSWQDITFMGGVFFNIPVTPLILFRPEISYGGVQNFATVEGQDIVYLDQIVQITPSFRFTNDKIKGKGFSCELAPLYAFFTQQGRVAHYLGLRAGINYEF